MYRVKEYNDIYPTGWIYVTNRMDFEAAEKTRIWCSHTRPHLKYVTEKIETANLPGVNNKDVIPSSPKMVYEDGGLLNRITKWFKRLV